MDKFLNKLSQLDCINAETSCEVISTKLSELINDIWKYGLTEQYLYKIVDIFIYNDDLDLTERQLILQCLVPQFIVKNETVENLLMWFFSKYLIDDQAAAFLLTWMGELIEYKLIETKCLSMFYGQLVYCFQSECLVKPLCRLLKLLTNEVTVNKRVAYLVEEFYKEFKGNEFKILMWEMKKYRPNDITVTFKSEPRANKVKTDFEKVLIKIARKQGISFPAKDIENEKVVAGTLPSPVYLEDSNPSALIKLTDITSGHELGRCISKLTLKIPDNPNTLIGTKVGLLYLQLMGPSEKFLASLHGLIESRTPAVISKLSLLQCRLRHGLPIITKYLAEFLLTWDGFMSRDVIYEIIPWVYFDSYFDLSNSILKPLTRLYICSCADIKVAILHSLNCLLINMVSVHIERQKYDHFKLYETVPRQSWLSYNPLDTFIKLSAFVQVLIVTGLQMEGLDCASVLLESVIFYNTVITLQLKFSLVCLIYPEPAIIYSSIPSLNHVVLSEIGALLVRYKREVIPLLDNLGVIDHFDEAIREIEEMSNTMFRYLWLGEEISGHNTHSLVETKERLRTHPAISPLITFIAEKLKINVSTVGKDHILQMLLNYSEGLGEFIQYHMRESQHQL